MIVLEQLYRLLAADEQVRQLDPFFQAGTVALANATVQLQATVPERHALLVTHVQSAMTPGAGQNITGSALIRLLSPNGTIGITLDQVVNALAANVAAQLRWTGEAILTPRSVIQADGRFNAGVAANQVTLSVHGMLIPLGNIERLI